MKNESLTNNNLCALASLREVFVNI